MMFPSSTSGWQACSTPRTSTSPASSPPLLGTPTRDGAAGRQEAARRKLEDCEQRLGKYRDALDAGADPVIVAGWIAEVKGAQLAAERELAQTRSDGQLMAEEVRQLVRSLKDIPKVLADSDPKLKAKVYGELGVRIAYEPGERPGGGRGPSRVYYRGCRRGDLNPHALSGTSPSS
jgi:site-specific DNA recombinase